MILRNAREDPAMMLAFYISAVALLSLASFLI
jgi:hypothetical protein